MHGQSKRLRILAGPNGSGKSTVVKKSKVLTIVVLT